MGGYEILSTEAAEINEHVVRASEPRDYFGSLLRRMREADQRAFEWNRRHNSRKSTTDILKMWAEKEERRIEYWPSSQRKFSIVKALREQNHHKQIHEKEEFLLIFVCFSLLLSNIWLYLTN